MLTLRYNEPVFILMLRGRVGCLRQSVNNTQICRVQWKFSHKACVSWRGVFHVRKTLNGNLVLEQAMKAQMVSGCNYSSFNLRGGWFVSCQSHAPAA